MEDSEKYRLNSDGSFFYEENYLKIENTNLPAHEAARRIAEAFGLASPESGAKSGIA